ncbi:MAG: site-specific DNA-methyltransferase [Ruminococcus sp.]|nr:site-specific DNA-methyltransferase [Ruminococcus sp.]
MIHIQIDTIYTGDCLDVLKTLPEESVNCCVTSPPYYALRDYGMEGQIGREETPKEYISRLTDVFTEVRQVLRSDGTLWLNISDTYAGKSNQGSSIDPKNPKGRNGQTVALNNKVEGCKPKDMIGIPWMLAFALRDSGWYLRNDIIWMKENPMPESVKDRCARCYEHIFLFSKSRKYHFDYKAISEPIAPATRKRLKCAVGENNKFGKAIPGQPQSQPINRPREHGSISDDEINPLRNKRNVWVINTVPFKGNHYAVYPPKLVETCLLAGCPEGGIVLDPFMGSGTTGMVAKQMNRHYVGIELNPEFTEMAYRRIGGAI